MHSQSVENKSQMRPTARILLLITLKGSVFSRTTARLDIRFHGKAVALDFEDRHPSWPLYTHGQEAIEYPILSGNDWQDWVVSDRVVNEEDEGSLTIIHFEAPGSNFWSSCRPSL